MNAELNLVIFDAHRRCPKCGGDASVSYHGHRLQRLDFQPEDTIIGRCTRCNFAWYELPLDRAEAAS